MHVPASVILYLVMSQLQNNDDSPCEAQLLHRYGKIRHS